jgi:hypothetical protein
LSEAATGNCFEGERVKAKAVALAAKLFSEYKRLMDEKGEPNSFVFGF